MFQISYSSSPSSYSSLYKVHSNNTNPSRIDQGLHSIFAFKRIERPRRRVRGSR